MNQSKDKKVIPQRDTTGLTVNQFRQIIDTLDRSTIKGKRDYALLMLMWSNALRRNEVRVKIEDFDAEEATLTIKGKGRTLPEKVNLPLITVNAINEWLACRSSFSLLDPLFISLSPACYGHPLTGDGVYKIVVDAAKKAGIEKAFSPNRLKHSMVTAMLDNTTNVRDVMKVTRHRKVDTLLIYNDKPVSEDAQKELSEIVSKLLG